MYHISLYFDEKTTAYMHKLIEKVAQATGNDYMLEAEVPPHITLCALECEEEVLMERLEYVFDRGGTSAKQRNVIVSAHGGREVRSASVLKQGTLQWVSIGTFLPGVIFVQPVLNGYLQGLMELVYACVQGSCEQAQDCMQRRENAFCATPKDCKNMIPDVKIKPCYKPFSWLPHNTVGKKLTPEQLTDAFRVLQKEFQVFEGKAVRIGLAKMNPHLEIASWELYEELL